MSVRHDDMLECGEAISIAEKKMRLVYIMPTVGTFPRASNAIYGAKRSFISFLIRALS